MSVVVGSSVVMVMYHPGRTRVKSKCLDPQNGWPHSVSVFSIRGEVICILYTFPLLFWVSYKL